MNTVFQMPDGTWSHRKTAHGGFATKGAAETDYRFCCEWEGELSATRAERDRAQRACEQIAKRLSE